MHLRPIQLDEALQNLAHGARVFAGATDLLPAVGKLGPMDTWVDVSRLESLQGIRRDGKCIRTGGATIWREIFQADLASAFNALKIAAREIGAMQIQNRGTLAGNPCNASPAAAGVPPMLIFDAEIELASHCGLRPFPLRDFLEGVQKTALAPDELLTAVICPEPAAKLRSDFYKLGARRYLVISIAMVALGLEIVDGLVREARVAVGACSAAAVRLPAADERLLYAPGTAALADLLPSEDFSALTPTDDVRAVRACVVNESGGIV